MIPVLIETTVRRVLREELLLSRARLIDAAQVAAMLGISISKVEDLTARGLLRPVYVDAARRYDVSAIESYIRTLPTKPAKKRGPTPKRKQ